MSELKIIPINELYEHPDNPRKDIGDVTELAESLRANGLLQYLTVIPGHWMTKSEYLDMAKREGVAKVDAVGSYDRENSFTPAGYTIIIGHRRFNAAKLAGLTELPCVVVAMTEKEQIGTMLTENMQRSDLTLYEEAKGFQMMLDLGSTVADVAQMAGFSETTVRRRAKLAELDEKKFKKAVDRGATLFDFAELDKIEDPEVKDELLAAMGTKDFKNKLSSALSDQKRRKLIEKWETQISEWATSLDDTEWSGNQQYGIRGKSKVAVDYVRNYGSWSRDKDEDVVRPDGDGPFFYKVNSSRTQIDLYRKHRRDAEADREKQERDRLAEERKKRLEQLNEITDRHRKLRLDFILDFDQYKAKQAEVLEFVTDTLMELGSLSYYRNDDIAEGLAKFLGISYDKEFRSMNRAELLSLKMENPVKTAFLMAWYFRDVDARRTGSYFKQDWCSEEGCYKNVYREDRNLDEIYRFLDRIGYKRSTEEDQMRTGTHELFDKVNEG